MKDWTSEVEAMAKEHVKKYNAPVDRTRVAVIKDYRKRQREGKASPRWGEWSEFEVKLVDGSPVTVLYDPKTWTSVDHFQFRGPMTSTGYRSHFDGRTAQTDRKKGETLVAYATRLARAFAAETDKELASKKVSDAKKKASDRRKRDAGFTPLFDMMGES